jgi:glycosyltransferase involved in cell wall biosynthesis
MRLVYLAHSIIPSRHANSVHVMKMCQALAAASHEVRLVVPKSPAEEEAVEDIFEFYGVDYTFAVQKVLYPSMRGQTTVAALHAACHIAVCRPDLIYSRAFDLCDRVCRVVPRPFALEAHAALDESFHSRFRRMLKNPRFRKLVVISQALSFWFVKTFPELEGRITIAPDAADQPNASCMPMSLKRNDRLVAGYCGQLFAGKGIKTIVDLARALPDIDFHVVGGDDALFAEWRNRVGSLDNLIFHGFQPNPIAMRYVAAFDVALAPYQERVTIYGGEKDIAPWMSPLKLFEYMSFGKPIICSDLPVLREILQDGRNALLCAPDDLKAWISALRRLSDASGRARLGDAARDDFEREYSWRRRADRIIAAIA